MNDGGVRLRTCLICFILLSVALGAALGEDVEKDLGVPGDDDAAFADARKGVMGRNLDDDNLDLTKEDFKALGLNREVGNLNSLTNSLKDLGLSDQEVAELKKVEAEAGTLDLD